MRCHVAWSDQAPDRDGSPTPVYCLAFKPDGTQLVAAVGNRVVVYNANEGENLQPLRGHTDTVYCVGWSADGALLASGGADKSVFVWTSEYNGVVRFTHNDAVQALSFSPASSVLCTVSNVDFGLWTNGNQTVNKHKLPARGLCCSWSVDGQRLAIGLYSGVVTVRAPNGDEITRVTHEGPVWSLSYSAAGGADDRLAVCSWDQKLTFYDAKTERLGESIALDYDPCTVSWFGKDYVVVGGSNRKAILYTREGVELGVICERDDWVWSAVHRPRHNYVAVSTNNGAVLLNQLVFGTVHGLYQDRYAVREHMTDVVLQSLTTDKRVRIQCRAWVKKIAIFRNRLAVQLPTGIAVYELIGLDEGTDLTFRALEFIKGKVECNLLVVTHRNVILCQERRLQMMSFKGDKEREWTLESNIRYIKVIGGPPGREGLLVGLKGGNVMKIFVDNPFPITLIKHRAAIRCLDLSATREMLAVVDEGANVVIYNLQSKDILMEEPGANSVAFNTELADMVCWSGSGKLNIKAADFPAHQQKLQGFVVGFKGSKVFCLHYLNMNTVDVPQSATLYRFLERSDLDGAYRVACLGVTENDWRALGDAALEAMNFEIARRAFVRVRDMKFLDLIAAFAGQRSALGRVNEAQFRAQMNAYRGRFAEAAREYASGKQFAAAVDMLSDMKMWSEAREWAREHGVGGAELFRRQAEASLESSDFREAAELFSMAGDRARAARIAVDNNFGELIVDIVSSCDKHETPALAKCAEWLRANGRREQAAEAYMKMGDTKNLVQLYVDGQQWDDAFRLAGAHPELESDVYLPFAAYRAEQGDFDGALDAFAKAGRTDKALNVLRQLAHNAVTEERFADASYYFFRLSMAHLSSVTSKSLAELTASDRVHIEQASLYRGRAELYFTYDPVYRSIQDPFTALPAESLFHMSRFLLSRLAVDGEVPLGMARRTVLYSLARFAVQLGAPRLGRLAYEQLLRLRVPDEWMRRAEVSALTVRSKPMHDRDDLMTTCLCCSLVNPLGLDRSEECSSCSHAFVRSFASFEVLPLVEFELDVGIEDDEAVELIQLPPPLRKARAGGAGAGAGGGGRRAASMHVGADVQTLTLDDHEDAIDDETGGGEDDDDPFGAQLDAIGSTREHTPLVATRDILRRLQPEEVFVVPSELPGILSNRYFRNVFAEVRVVLCRQCRHFFHQEDYEFSALKASGCPFCKFKGPVIRAASIDDATLFARGSSASPSTAGRASITDD